MSEQGHGVTRRCHSQQPLKELNRGLNRSVEFQEAHGIGNLRLIKVKQNGLIGAAAYYNVLAIPH
jgi:hypothetical protein